jgi:hypothetical protein
MTEKQVLLRIRKNIKNKEVSICIDILCNDCYYFAGVELQDFCKRSYMSIINDWEGLYIEKFGIESLVEELL